MEIRKIYSIFILLLIISFTSCYTLSTSKMDVVGDENNTISSIVIKDTKVNWLSGPTRLYKIENDKSSLEKDLVLLPRNDGSLLLTLVLRNAGNVPLDVKPIFPFIENVSPEGVDSRNLFCFFPKQGEMINNRTTINYEESYSGNFPFQFIDVYSPSSGGLCVMTLDTLNTPKNYFMKKDNSIVSMGVKYRTRKLQPGETWILPNAVIYPHIGDWHEAFYYYRDWVRTWYKPLTARKEWFRDVYNFRQLFLHRIFGEDGAFNTSSNTIDLLTKVDESVEAFGGVDYVHLFDWGQDPVSGRCGDYTPWNFYGEKMKEELTTQIDKLNERGIKTGLYHEGYLLSKVSKIAKEHGVEWNMLDRNGNSYLRMGDEYYYACPYVQEWQKYLSDILLRNTDLFNISGLYVDQYGFGWQYPCMNPSHGHEISSTEIAGENQILAETEMMSYIKRRIPEQIVTYTEECPTDVSTQYQDGSFSYGVFNARKNNSNPAVLNLTRFAFPDYKIFELLHVDTSFGNDVEGVKHVFFNGNGLWLEGPLNDPSWFTDEVRETIRKCYSVIKRNVESFRSDNPEPLVPTLYDGVYANLFPTSNKNLWTIFNSYYMDMNVPVLKIPHIDGCKYYDEWNQKEINPKIEDGYAIINCEMKSRDVQCISQQW